MPTPPSKDILLIPSAVLVPPELRLDVGAIPTGMIPLQGRPMLDRIVEAYDGLNIHPVVAVGESKATIEEFVSRSNREWTVVDVGETTSVGDTILAALDSLPNSVLADQQLYINFADTLVDPVKPVSSSDYVTFQHEERSFRWTTFDIKDRKIGSITEKSTTTENGPQPAFVGQFGLVNPAQFRDGLSATDNSESKLDKFYTALLDYLGERNEYELIEPETWVDVGHLDTFHRAKREFLNVREFNEIDVDEAKHVVVKRSDDDQTLSNEIRWYAQIPSNLKPYTPQVYDWTLNESARLEIEYVGYPSLSDLQLYGDHGQHIWDGVFRRIFTMHGEFREHTADADQDEIQDALSEIYLDKTHRRLETVKNRRRFAALFEADEVQINGDSYPSMPTILGGFEDAIEDYGLLDRDDLTAIHGDLCFPNILYDPRNEIIKLIDPRGEFGDYTIYGDPRYDLAKLRHSVVGNYEHLINDRFEAVFDADGPAIDYNVYTTEAQETRMSHFDSLITSQTEADLVTIKLVEALLYLSMIPLHSDSRERQLTMLAKGIEKITPFIDEMSQPSTTRRTSR